MWRMPIRLWSTVVSQLANRPSYQAGVRTGSALAATASSLLRLLLEVGDERLDLDVAPTLADGGHTASALRHQLGQAVRVDEERVRADVRADQRRTARGQVVALRADGVSDLGAELRVRHRHHRAPLPCPRLVL